MSKKQIIKATDQTFMTCQTCHEMSHGKPTCYTCLHNMLLITALKEALADAEKNQLTGLAVGTAIHQAVENELKQYIYYTDPIKAIEGGVDTNETIEDWINSDPYPGYELCQFNYTSRGHQTLWRLKNKEDQTND